MVTCQFSLYLLRTEQRDEIFGVVESSQNRQRSLHAYTVLADAPETINADPYRADWMIKFKPANPAEWDNLLPGSAYEKIAANE